MEKKKVIIVKSNVIFTDTRLTKEYKSLTQHDYDTRLLCWNRENQIITTSLSLEYNHSAIFNLKAPYGMRIILYLPLWWFFIAIQLLKQEWDIVHVINFDSYIPSLFISKLKKKKIVYEIEDTYEDQNALPKIIREFFIFIDKLFMRFADAIILVDECQVIEFRGIPNTNVSIIYDSPPDLFSQGNSKNLSTKFFNIFYPAVFFKSRRLNLENFIQSLKTLDDIKLTITGYGDQKEKISQWAKEMPEKIEFLGWVPDCNDIFKRMHEANLTFALKDPSVPLNKYICGSKLFEAMMCSTPILVNKNTSLAKKVQDYNCGLVIDALNVEEIQRAVIMLMNDPDLCKVFGENGRNAYEKIYNWDIIEKRLLFLYNKLF